MSTASFETAIILNLLKIAKLAICARGTIPQLANVTFRSADGVVTMSTTDLDMELTLEIPLAVMSDGSFNISLPELQKFLSSADKGGLVTVYFDTAKACVTSDGMARDMEQCEPADIPVMQPFNPTLSPVSMPEKDLHAILSTCQHAISDDETRYYLQGVYVHETSTASLGFVSTDGHRMAFVETPRAAPNGLSAIIPTSAVKALLATLDAKSSLPCVMQFSPSHVVVSGSSFKLHSRVVQGTFPDYTRVIPYTDDVLTFKREDLAKPLARFMKLAEKNNRGVVLDFAQGLMRSKDGKTRAPLSFTGSTDAAVVGLMGHYLTDTLAALHGDNIRLALAATEPAGSPLTFPIDDSRWLRALLIVMPLRV